MDEPTTGLDGSTALDVMQLVKAQAIKTKRTVVTTIHQPSFEISECFDNIMCIVKGHLVYFGPPDKVGKYWAQLGMHMEDFTNPCDFMMRIVNDSDIRMVVPSNQ